MTPKRVLVLQLARLGDLVQTWPLLRRLRAGGPQARLELVCDAGLAALTAWGPRLDGLFGLEMRDLAARAVREPAAVGRRLQAVLAELRRQGYEKVFNLNFSRLSLLLTHAVGAPARGYQPLLGGREFGRPPWLAYVFALAHVRRLNPLHLSDVFRHLAPVAPEDPPPGAARPSPGREPLLALVPGTRHPKRTWPPAAFAGFVRELSRHTPVRFLLVGTAGERPLGEAILRELSAPLRERVHNLLGRTGLGELPEHLLEADLVVGGDTGALHLAAALGVACLGLYFGPALAAETGPYGPGHLVLQAEPPCHPCREGDPCADPFCSRLLTPELAARAALALLAGERGTLPPLPPQVRLYRSSLDGLGAVYLPGDGRPPEAADLAAAAYRAVAGRLAGLNGAVDRPGEIPPDLKATLARLAGVVRGRNGDLAAAEPYLLLPLKAFRAEAVRQGTLQGRRALWEELAGRLAEEFALLLEAWAA